MAVALPSDLLGVKHDDMGERIQLDLTARLNHENPMASMDLDLVQYLELHDSQGMFTKALAEADGVARPFRPSAVFVGLPARGTVVFPAPPGAGPYRLLLPFAENPVSLDIPAEFTPVIVEEAELVEPADPEPQPETTAEALTENSTVADSDPAETDRCGHSRLVKLACGDRPVCP